MDANSRKICGLISEMNTRFVVPVYQRPYSWGEEQCAQLWDDILSTGRGRSTVHFTGSIVTIQDGSLSDQGVAPLLLIDGQQRITTISLLLVALARFAARHPNRELPFSAKEILVSGYLTNRFRTGEDYYKLTLSKTDRAAYRAVVDALGTNVQPELDPSTRLAQNLAYFERRVEALDDVEAVWAGLHRLEVVAIALSQGQDDPQLIFESMNATGKDLSNADLVRNFVLMSYTLDEQPALYHTYWQPIEQILGTSHFDESFDDFLRSYLTIMHAPTSMAKVDVYQAFKRYVLFNSYHKNDRMKNLSLKIKRFARYYAAVVNGDVSDPDLAQAFIRIDQLGEPSVRPLLVALYDGFEHQEFSRAQFLDLVTTLESYLFRRAVCDCAGSTLAPFFSSLIARIDAVRAEEGDVVEALHAMLLNEAGTARRFPTNAEFQHALTRRDIANFAGARYLLVRLEQVLGDGSVDLDLRVWTIEHVMPMGALDDASWLSMLGERPERAFEDGINSLGNLTLTSAGFDLQEGSLEHKQERVAEDGLAISQDVLEATSWTPERIEARAAKLAALALELWPIPELPEGAGKAYRLSQRAAATKDVSFQDLFDAGLVEMDDALVSVSPMHPGKATVTSTGKIMLANGEMFEDPTAAYERFLTSLGASPAGQSGWMYWRRGEGGPLLDDLRAEL
ncbi:MAG: DUF262 domain-containing protein [Atopobiaceae bacterium]|nr:DUF262 domain-containing protein [Atopobiaceae bacterium]